MPTLKSLSDFDQKPSRLLPRFPIPPPLDHLVGGGGDQLPRAALLSWGGTLLVLVGGRAARGWSWRLDPPPPAGIHGSEAGLGAAAGPAAGPTLFRWSAQDSHPAAG